MMQVRDIQIGKKVATAVFLPLPADRGGESALVVATGRRGFLACGLLSLSAAEEGGAACAVVRGAVSIDGLLEGEVWGASAKARRLGVRAGMTGLQALKKLL